LSDKTLLKPFNTALSGKAAGHDVVIYQDDNSHAILKDNEGDGDADTDADINKVLQHDDDSDELQELNKEDQEQMLDDTAAFHMTATKVRFVNLPFMPTNYLIVYRFNN